MNIKSIGGVLIEKRRYVSPLSAIRALTKSDIIIHSGDWELNLPVENLRHMQKCCKYIRDLSGSPDITIKMPGHIVVSVDGVEVKS